MRFLIRLRTHLARRDVPELTLPRELSVFPDSRNHLERLFPHGASVARIDPHADLLVGGGAPGAELHSTAGEVIDHRDALGHPDGMMVGQDDHAESQANALR